MEDGAGRLTTVGALWSGRQKSDHEKSTEYLPIPTRAGGVIEPHGRHLSALV